MVFFLLSHHTSTKHATRVLLLWPLSQPKKKVMKMITGESKKEIFRCKKCSRIFTQELLLGGGRCPECGGKVEPEKKQESTVIVKGM